MVAVAAGPLLLAAAGLTHPGDLGPATAAHWRALHVALLPVWPLLGLSLVLLVRAERRAWVALVGGCALVYTAFYGALDAVNGVAVGDLVARAVAAPEALRPLIRLGNTLAFVGSGAFLLGALVTAGLLLRRHGRAALPGALLTAAAAVSFLDSHVYWPRGVLTMLVLAAGLVLLARADTLPAGTSRRVRAVPS